MAERLPDVSSSLPDAIEAVRPCVVQILLRIGHQRPQAIGTGFIVDRRGLVLTARHVTEARTEVDGASSLYVGLAQPNSENMRGNFSLVEGKVLEEDNRHDLAVLQMDPNPFDGKVSSGILIGHKPVPLFFDVATRAAGRPRDGTPIAVSGYPLRESVMITTSGALASSWALDIKEVQPPAARAGFTFPDVRDSYLADVSVNPGNSGGPVYRVDDGGIVGVCVAFRNVVIRDSKGGPIVINDQPLQYNSGLSVVVPIVYGEELIARHVPSPEPDEGKR